MRAIPVRIVVRLCLSLVALAAFAWSFQSLMTLGQFAGYGALSWLCLVVGLGTVSSCIIWLGNAVSAGVLDELGRAVRVGRAERHRLWVDRRGPAC